MKIITIKIVLLILSLFLNCCDAQEVTEPMMHLESRFNHLADDENAYVLWGKAVELYVPIGDPNAIDEIRDHKEDLPTEKYLTVLKTWLKDNERALQIFDKGLARDKCQFPNIKYLDEIDYKTLIALRNITRLKIVKAKLSAANGDHSEAIVNMFDVVRAGELMTSDETLLITYLIAVNIQRNGLDGIYWLSGQNTIGPEKLLELEITLRRYDNYHDDLVKCYRGEYNYIKRVVERNDLKEQFSNMFDTFGVDVIDSDDVREVIANYKYDKSFILNSVNKTISFYINKSSKPWNSKFVFDATVTGRMFRSFQDSLESGLGDVTPGFENDYRPIVDMIKMGDLFIEKSLISNHPQSFGGTLKTCLVCKAKRSAVRTILMIQAYKRKFSRLPETLESILSGNIAKKLPIDPFSGKPFRYSCAKKAIWSVGVNGKDDRAKQQGSVIGWSIHNKGDLLLCLPGCKSPDDEG